MARLNRCTCGRVPRFRCRPTGEGTFITQATCPRIECEAQGPAVEDTERNEEAAALMWNRHGGRKAA